MIDGWVFVLQKLPPAEYWAKRTRCGLDPYCSSPNRTPEASSYRLILESKRSLMLSKIPIDAIEGWERLQQDARSTTILCTKIQASPQTKTTYTKKIDVATPYCLECIEKLWDGHGMVHEASTLTPSSSLTAILSSLYPETRADPNRSGYYTITPPQAYGLEKWKAIANYRITIMNLKRNGLRLADHSVWKREVLPFRRG